MCCLCLGLYPFSFFSILHHDALFYEGEYVSPELSFLPISVSSFGAKVCFASTRPPFQL